MELYLFQNDEETGPLPAEEVQAMLEDGVLDPQTPAWLEGLPDWTPVGGLFQLPLPPPPKVSSPQPGPPVVVPLPAAPPAAAARGTGFFAAIPAAFGYPLKGDGPLLLFGGTLLYSLLTFFTRLPTFFFLSVLVTIIAAGATGYYVSYLQRVVSCAAQGDPEMPTWPELSSLWEDCFGPFFRTLALFLLCVAPGWISLEQGIQAERTDWIVLGAALLLGGSLYLPMAFLGMAIADGWAGAHPKLILPSMLKVAGPYLVTWVLLLLVMLLLGFVGEAIRRWLPLPILPTVLNCAVSLYLLSVEMRLLGQLYHFNRRKLNWV